jgi:predicted RNA-binding protein with PIN domain
VLLVDAYNVLHVPMPPALAGLDEAGLCTAIARSRFAGQSAVVVCDGRPKPLGAEASPVESVQLLYSGVSRKADHVIMDMVARHSAPRRVLVVTNDREIRAAARRRRARLMHSEDFITRLASSLGQRAPAAGRAKPSPDDLDDDAVQRWIEEFGL